MEIRTIMIPQNAHIKYIKMQNNERRCMAKFLQNVHGEIIINKGCVKP